MSPAKSADRVRAALAVFGWPLLVVLVPVVGYWSDGYVLVPTLFYQDYVPTVSMLSALAFRALLCACVFAMALTLFHPRWLPSTLRSSRLVCFAFTVWLAIVAYIVRVEGDYLGQRVVSADAEAMQRLFQTLQIGLTTEDVLARRNAVDENIRYTYGDSSPYRDLAGYPYLNPQPVVVLAFPGIFAQPRVVVEMSDNPSLMTSKAMRISLVSAEDLINTKPKVDATTNQIYRGFVSFNDQADRFVSCDGSAFIVVFEPDAREVIAKAGPPPYPAYAQFSASVDERTVAQPEPHLRVSRLFKAGGQRDITGKPMLAEAKDGTSKPWECVYP